MWQIVIKGGVMMYPILFFSIVALTVIFERLWILISAKFPESETIEAGLFLPGKKSNQRSKKRVRTGQNDIQFIVSCCVRKNNNF